MKNSSLVLLLVLLVVPAMAQVKSDYDKTVDFTKYKTYKFEGWAKDSDKQLNDFDKKRIQDAMVSELSARGMSGVQSGGDVAVTLFIVVDDKTSTTAYTNYTGGMGYGVGRWGWGMGAGMGMGSATTTYSENDYKQGTFVVDFYDSGTKKLVWQGIIQTVVQEKPEKREKTIPKNVSKLMKQYPVKPVK